MDTKNTIAAKNRIAMDVSRIVAGLGLSSNVAAKEYLERRNIHIYKALDSADCQKHVDSLLDELNLNNARLRHIKDNV